MNEQEESALMRLIESNASLTASNLAIATALQALAAAISEQTLESDDDVSAGGTYLSGEPL